METKETFKDNAIKWGAIGGFFYVITAYILYLIVQDARVVTFPFSLIPYCSPLLFMIIAALLKRHYQGNLLSFKEGVSVMFKVMVISLLFYGVFEYALFNQIAPKLNESCKALTYQSSAKLMRTLMGMNEDQIAEQLQVYASDDFKMTIKRELIQVLYSIVKSFALISIIAVVLRKKSNA